jgi:hypothetical protein
VRPSAATIFWEKFLYHHNIRIKKSSRAHKCTFKNIPLFNRGLSQFSVPWLEYTEKGKIVFQYFLIPGLFIRLNYFLKGIFRLKFNLL